jgi:uncharacterized membrane protein (UPF0127 family)
VKRRLLLAVVVGLLIAGAVSGLHGGPTTYVARRVVIGDRVYCWPTATTLAEQHQGLQGVTDVRYPLVFVFDQPRVVGFWMKNSPVPLTGAWISPQGRVAGYWHGKPETLTPHYPRRPVALTVEFPSADEVPAVGARVVLEGQCSARSAL